MPRSKRPRLGRPPSTSSVETRARILDVAREAFAQLGYSVTTNKDLASKAGITTGAIYHYFESKAAIYAAVRDDVNVIVYDRFEAAAGGGPHTFRDRFEAVLEAAHDLNDEDPTLARFLGAVRIDSARHEDLRLALTTVKSRRGPLVASLIDCGIETGEIAADDREAVAAFIQIVLIGLTDGYSTDPATHRVAVDCIRKLIRGRLISPPRQLMSLTPIVASAVAT